MLSLLRRWLGRTPAQLEVSDEIWRQVEAELPFLNHLTAEQRQRLRQMSLRFIAQKQWCGAQGLQLTVPMQLSIALQACLLVLELGLEPYDGWVGIVIYPGDFIIPRQIIDDDGVMHEYDDIVLGEAWHRGPILLSWFDQASEAPAGINVVLHEFAHQLDMADGLANGTPPLPSDLSHREWQRTFTAAYEDFCRRVDEAEFRGEALALDPYAAESPAEFFAVCTEAFFETPALLEAEYPAIYRLLARFYRQEPLKPHRT